MMDWEQSRYLKHQILELKRAQNKTPPNLRIIITVLRM